MKKQLHLSLAIILAINLFAGLGGCSKKDSASPKEIISGRKWVLTAQTINPGVSRNGSTITDLYSQILNCTRDDISIYMPNGQYQEEEGATKCKQADPQIIQTGTWTLSSDNKTLAIITAQGTIQFTITQLDNSTLAGTYVFVDGGVQYTVTATAKAI